VKQLIEALVTQPEFVATGLIGGMTLALAQVYAHNRQQTANEKRAAEDFVDVIHLVSGRNGAATAGLEPFREAPTGTMWQEHAAALCADLPEGYDTNLQNTALDMYFERTIAKYVAS
jgi:hypothetical protein